MSDKTAKKPESKYPVNMTDTPFPMRGDLATLTAAIDNDAAIARNYFAQN